MASTLTRRRILPLGHCDFRDPLLRFRTVLYIQAMVPSMNSFLEAGRAFASKAYVCMHARTGHNFAMEENL